MTETQTLIAEFGTLSYVGIFAVALLANVFIPVPEEIVLLILGYVSGLGTFDLVFLIPIVIFGSLLGDIGMYFLARKNNKLVTVFYNKFFARIIEKKGDLWVENNIKKIIFFSRFMIQFRFIGPFLAGQKKVLFKTFVVYDLIALCLYVPLYVVIGKFFSSRINFIISGVNIFKNIILVFICIVFVFALTKVLYKNLLKK